MGRRKFNVLKFLVMIIPWIIMCYWGWYIRETIRENNKELRELKNFIMSSKKNDEKTS